MTGTDLNRKKRHLNKETYIDSFPGKLGTAMLGKKGGRRGRRETQGDSQWDEGKERKRTRTLKRGKVVLITHKLLLVWY